MRDLPFETHYEDGNPTEELLDYIEGYNVLEDGSLGLIKLVYNCWSYDYPYRSYYLNEKGDTYVVDLATGGWSGNESLITNLQWNSLFWSLNWFYSQRGGKHQFHVKSNGQDWEEV